MLYFQTGKVAQPLLVNTSTSCATTLTSGTRREHSKAVKERDDAANCRDALWSRFKIIVCELISSRRLLVWGIEDRSDENTGRRSRIVRQSHKSGCDRYHGVVSYQKVTENANEYWLLERPWQKVECCQISDRSTGCRVVQSSQGFSSPTLGQRQAVDSLYR